MWHPMGPTKVLSALGEPHVGPLNFAIRDFAVYSSLQHKQHVCLQINNCFSEKNYQPYYYGNHCCTPIKAKVLMITHTNCSKAQQHHTFDNRGIAWEVPQQHSLVDKLFMWTSLCETELKKNFVKTPKYSLVLSSIGTRIAQVVKMYPLERHGFVYSISQEICTRFLLAVLCCGYTLTDFPISIRLTTLALWQSNDCPSASKATLMNMDKYFMWIHYERLHNHNKAKHNKTVYIFLGIYCISLYPNDDWFIW